MKKKVNFALSALLVYLCIMVSGCQKSDSTEVLPDSNETAEAIEAPTVGNEKEIPSPTSTSTPIPEPTAEPTPAPVAYEEIDMESALPGIEWIATFEGIINEPKIVIFNDETNKKVIVENGQSVPFESGDMFLVYTPNSEGMSMISGLVVTNSDMKPNYTLLTAESELAADETNVIVTLGTLDELYCTLLKPGIEIPSTSTEAYDTIDTSSTLSGTDWISTFEGTIKNPIIAVYNDETNKKVIVEDGQSVSFENGDIFIVYTPNSEKIAMVSGIEITDIQPRSNYTIYTFKEDYLMDKTEIPLTFTFDTQDTLSCTLQPEL